MHVHIHNPQAQKYQSYHHTQENIRDLSKHIGKSTRIQKKAAMEL